MKAFGKGIRFGTMLQLAIGPMCLLTFQTAAWQGFSRGLVVVAGILLADILYLGLAGLGVARLFGTAKARRNSRWFAAAVLVIFGAHMALGSLGRGFLPEPAWFSTGATRGLLITCFLLTASNPLTIVFFSGVLTGQLADDQPGFRELVLFSAGTLTATVLFLTGVAALGTVSSRFLSEGIINLLQGLVGLYILAMGLSMVLKKESGQTAG